MKKGLKLFAILVVLFSLCIIPFTQALAIDEVPAPIDPQSWKLHRDMDWDELTVNPVVNWMDDWSKYTGDTRTIKGALILVEYWDRPFISSQEVNTDTLGWKRFGEDTITQNPMVSIERDKLADWWADFLNEPQDINNYLTINEYWRENTYGKWEVEVDGFGPYTIPYFEFETMGYDLRSGFQSLQDVPPTFRPASSRNGIQLDAVVRDEVIPGNPDFHLDDYDFFFILHAGYDESGVWQEFGEMQWADKEDVPYELGPAARLDMAEEILTENPEYVQILANRYPNDSYLAMCANEVATMTAAGTLDNYQFWFNDTDREWAEEHGNYSGTRYVEWTSWAAGVGEWSHMSSMSYTKKDGTTGSKRYSTQGENDGMATFAHEFGHISEFGDNYGNPFTARVPAATGGWDIMSRGSFSGPGGDHERWEVPGTTGGTVPTHLMIGGKRELGIYNDDDTLEITIDELAQMYPLVTKVVARNIPLDNGVGVSDLYKGIVINFTNETQDQATIVNSGYTNFQKKASSYGLEVIQRTGYDSFVSDSGVMISRMTYQTPGALANAYPMSGNPFRTVVDSHLYDIGLVDYTLNGVDEYFPIGHQEQMADALFHAGVSEIENEYGVSGNTVNEWQDEANKLRFYVLDKHLTEADYGDYLSYTVGVLHEDGKAVTGELEVRLAELEKEEAGKVAVQWVNIVSGGNADDIIRLDVSSGLGWDITILNNFFVLGEFENVKVPIYISIPEGVEIGTVEDFDLTITVTSESNPARTGSVTVADIGNTVIEGDATAQLQPLASISAPSEVYLDGDREIHYVISVDDIQRAGAFVLEGQFDLNRLDYIGTEVNLAAKHEAFAYELADAYDAATGRYWLPIVLRGDDFRTYEEAALLTIKFKVKDSFGDESLYQNVTGNLNWMEVTLLDVDREATEVLATIVKGSADTVISKVGLKYDINKDNKYTMADIVMIMDRYYKVNSDDTAWADAVTYDIVADGEINTGDLVAFLDLLYK